MRLIADLRVPKIIRVRPGTVLTEKPSFFAAFPLTVPAE